MDASTLDEPCPKCERFGRKSNPKWDKWLARCQFEGATLGEALLDVPRMEPYLVDCPKCKGASRILTGQGRALLAFLQRHGVQFGGGE